jgi:CRISPR-associated exonuclease Cas4
MPDPPTADRPADAAPDPMRRWDPDDLVMISALEHYSYCPRQCALIHVEQSYEENVYTLRGNRAHARVDTVEHEVREGVRVERALPLWSARLGLTGRADVVELLPDGTPYPVEYKHGRTRKHVHAELQLCAQACCLEEMTGREVPKGAIFHTTSHRRQEIAFTPALRAEVARVTEAVRSMLRAARVPPPVDDARCPPCSLKPVCLPGPVAARARQQHWARLLFQPLD